MTGFQSSTRLASFATPPEAAQRHPQGPVSILYEASKLRNMGAAAALALSQVSILYEASKLRNQLERDFLALRRNVSILYEASKLRNALPSRDRP